MRPGTSDSLPGSPTVRRVASVAGLVVLFRFLLQFTWPEVAIVCAVILASESVDIGRDVPGIDERHVRLGLGSVVLLAGGYAAWRGSTIVAAAATAIGGWIALDALYSLRAGIRVTPDDDDPGASETMLLMQVGHLVADELRDEPKTVQELAEDCDMTESRVRDALELHERAGTVHRDGDHWVLDERRVGLRAFVGGNARWVGRRLARPFRLFAPS